MNVMDLIKPLISQALVSKAASWLGESESSVAKAIGAALPMLFGVLANRASDKGLLSQLGSLIGSNDAHGANILAEPQNLFASSLHGSEQAGLGEKFLQLVLGSQQQGVNQALSQHAGIGVGSATKLMSSLAPLALSFLGKQSAGSDLANVLSGLSNQKSSLAAAVPGALGSLLGLSAHSDAAASFNSNRSGDQKKGGFPLWLIPLGAALAFGAYWMLKPAAQVDNGGRIDHGNGVTSVPVEGGVAVVNSEKAPPSPTKGMQDPDITMSQPVLDPISLYKDVGEITEKVLPGDIKLSIPTQGIEAKLVAFIEDPAQAPDKEAWFNFDRILFDTEKATLRSESNEQINNIALIMKAFPNVQLKIGGYTDNQGDSKANLQLSANRAASVVAAIVAQGVDASRLQSEGYGDQHPVSDNNSSVGRQMNRRVAARVSAK